MTDMDTTKQQATLIGRMGYIAAGNGLYYDVTIVDVKKSYGRVRAECIPVSGHGHAWYDLETITLIEATTEVPQ